MTSLPDEDECGQPLYKKKERKNKKRKTQKVFFNTTPCKSTTSMLHLRTEESWLGTTVVVEKA